MDILGILFILWAIVTIFEVVIIDGIKVSTFKYVKLLKFLENIIYLYIKKEARIVPSFFYL